MRAAALSTAGMRAERRIGCLSQCGTYWDMMCCDMDVMSS
jgi:hypothetical protein